jgi:hypothetical protein
VPSEEEKEGREKAGYPSVMPEASGLCNNRGNLDSSKSNYHD